MYRARAAKSETVRNLPLFGERYGESPGVPAHGGPDSDPLALVLHVYWSASTELHALGFAILQAKYPDQRRALLALRDVEAKRKEIARQALEAVWNIRFAVPSSGESAAPGTAA